MNDLKTLLESATDRLEAPHRVAAALVQSRQRRLRTRAVAATATVLAVAGGTLGLVSLEAGRPDLDRPVDSPTSSPPAPAPTTGPATQPLWDPFDIPSLPWASSLLPRVLAPPDQVDSVTERVMGLVLVAWPKEGADLRLLDVDGTWRSVPGTADAVRGTPRPVVRPAVSHDGTRVAMATNEGLLVVDVADGSMVTLPWVAELAPPWDTPPDLRWLAADRGLLVLDWRGPWLVGLGGGMTELPYRGRFVSLAVDPSGPVYQNDYERRRLLTWGEEVQEAPFVQCERMVALDGLVACTAGSLEAMRSGPVVIDASAGELLGYAPIQDRNAVYSDNAHLTALGFLDADTVLLLVGPADFRDADREEAWHLVEWDFLTGRFERLASGGADMREVVVAPGVLGVFGNATP